MRKETRLCRRQESPVLPNLRRWQWIHRASILQSKQFRLRPGHLQVPDERRRTRPAQVKCAPGSEQRFWSIWILILLKSVGPEARGWRPSLLVARRPSLRVKPEAIRLVTIQRSQTTPRGLQDQPFSMSGPAQGHGTPEPKGPLRSGPPSGVRRGHRTESLFIGLDRLEVK